uniref:Uncharacterized protein LOC114338639 n=1 Tax=Diabrotica virgifera virgifera TaxID=50390 RepID=A0A6P7GIL1_DIAVI
MKKFKGKQLQFSAKTMTKEELLKFIQTTQADTDNEKRQKEIVCKEKEQLNESLTTSQKELREMKLEFVNKDQKLQQVTDEHVDNINFYKNQMTDLQSGNQKHLLNMKEKAKADLHKVMEEYTLKEKKLLQDNHNTKILIEEQEIKNNKCIESYRNHVKSEIQDAKDKIDRRFRESDAKYEKRYAEIKRLMQSINM